MSISRRVGAMRRPWLMVAVLVSAIALMLGMTTALSSNKAHAEGSRDTLRPGCTWDAAAYWVQKCTVHSDAMNKDIPVQIQAANGNGNAAFTFWADSLGQRTAVAGSTGLMLRTFLLMTTSRRSFPWVVKLPSILIGRSPLRQLMAPKFISGTRF